jgi:dipeptidyl aminopeptidase/acylaminoacyl peptidase
MRTNCTKLIWMAGMGSILTAWVQPSAHGQAAQAQGQEGATTVNAKLIPRTVLFGNPEKAAARISPNGKWLSFLAPVDGVMNVWVAPRDDVASAQPVTEDKVRGIRSYYWAYTGDHILYTQDKNGDENWHVYATDVEKKTTADLTPIDGVHAQIDSVSEKFPEEILVGLNDRNPQLHDIWRVNVLTGEKELVQENPGFAGFMADDDYRIRFAVAFTPDGGQQLMAPDEAEGWKPYIAVTAEDAMTFGPAGFDKTGKTLYLMDSRNRNTSALFTLDLESNEQKLIAEDEKADVGGILAHPTEKNIESVSFTYARRKWKVIDEKIADDLEYLRGVEPGEFEITSRTLDDKWWTVAYILDDGPVKYYLYDSEAKQAKFLFSNRSDLDQYDLVKMHPVVIKSRDGMDLVSYYSLPPGTDTDGDGLPERPVPMVLNVHGGPWGRDGWGFDPEHQWMANRGYAVLSVNFRGSTGFGKNFTNAANGEWSGKMHDDLIDAVEWAVAQKIADPERVAIMGGSYGGYATLVGLTFTPDRFACGVDIVGPSNLVTLLNNMPPYWMPIASMMKDRVGDWTSEGGREQLLKRSPLTLVEKIERPLLIGQGANDPRVKQVEADQIVEAMQEKNIPVTYVLYPDEGHGFARPENRLSFYAVAEAFLADHLSGRFEPVGEDFQGSSIQVPAGAAGVPGLEKALENVAP